MPIDANIITQGLAQFQKPADPIERYARVQALRNGATQAQIQQLQLTAGQQENQQRQIAIDSDAAGRKLFASAGDPTDSQILSTYGAAQGSAILKNRLEARTALATLQKTKSEVAAHEQDYFGALASAVKNAKYDPQALDLALQDAERAGYGPHVQQLKQTVAQNPDALPQMLDQLIQASPKQRELNTAALDAQTKVDAEKRAKEKDARLAPGETANAEMAQVKLGFIKNTTPATLGAQIDAIIDPAKYPDQNAQAKSLGSLALKSGGPEAAYNAVKDVYAQIGGAQGEALKIPVKVAEQTALLPGAVREAGAKASAEVGAHVATAVKTHQALAKLSPDAFAGIANPTSQNAAMNEADKVYKEYTDKASSTQTLLDTIAAAQKGNKAAPGVIPIEQVRSVLANGRVNAMELKGVSSNAGSLMDRIEGKLSGLKDGQPIPADVLRDTAELAKITQNAARRNFDAGKDRLKMRGVDVTKLPEPNVGAGTDLNTRLANAKEGEIIPLGNGHSVKKVAGGYEQQ